MEAIAIESVARHLAALLANVPSVWATATPDERDRLTWQLYAEGMIENRTVMKVKPRSQILPFFQAAYSCVGGSDGDRSRTFRTSSVHLCGSQSWTSDPVRQPLLAGHRGVKWPHTPVIAAVLASSRPTRRPRSARWP